MEAWLVAAPGARIALGTPAARRAIVALLEGWATGIVDALATRPLSLTELDAAIPALSYPALERRLTAMRRSGLVRSVLSGNGRTRYTVGDWLLRAAAPLAAAASWERRWR